MAEIVTVPLSKLVASDANMRKTARDSGVEELAASIAAHGLLQNLTVRPVVNGDGHETGKFEVVAGGRRLAALKLLAKRKVTGKAAPIACALLGDASPTEVSLAENLYVPPHPADQYEAFRRLHEDGFPRPKSQRAFASPNAWSSSGSSSAPSRLSWWRNTEKGC